MGSLYLASFLFVPHEYASPSWTMWSSIVLCAGFSVFGGVDSYGNDDFDGYDGFRAIIGHAFPTFVFIAAPIIVWRGGDVWSL